VPRHCPGFFPERPGAYTESLTIIGSQVWVLTRYIPNWEHQCHPLAATFIETTRKEMKGKVRTARRKTTFK